jgi:hypothetical protein
MVHADLQVAGVDKWDEFDSCSGRFYGLNMRFGFEIS